MGFKCGIVGLPNVGKSTLFNALTQTAAAQAANYPFCTIEPNVGEIAVPDPRLDRLAVLGKSEQIITTRITFVYIAGLVRGASKGEGLGNQFLATLEKRIDALEKKAKGTGEDAKSAKEMLDLINRALVLLREGKPARMVVRKPEEEKLFHSLGLLTSAPVLYACNVEEASAASGNDFSRKVEQRAKEEGAVAVVISAKIESEIATLPPAERVEFLAAVGLQETGLDRLIRAGYALLHLVTYFTVGPKETKAWTITQGTKAPQAAGVIHSDFERGFIRSETIGYDDYIAGGGEAGARDAGKLRLEGKDYVVADGDVLHFRFAT